MKTYSSILLVIACTGLFACGSKDKKGGGGSGSDGSGATSSTGSPTTSSGTGDSGSASSTTTSSNGNTNGSTTGSGGSGSGGDTGAGGSGGTTDGIGGTGTGGGEPGGAGGEGGDPGEEEPQPGDLAQQACQAFYDALTELDPDCTSIQDMIARNGCMDIFDSNPPECEDEFAAWHLCMAESDVIVTNPGEANCGFTTQVPECNDLRAAVLSHNCGN